MKMKRKLDALGMLNRARLHIFKTEDPGDDTGDDSTWVLLYDTSVRMYPKSTEHQMVVTNYGLPNSLESKHDL